jgi:integrase
VFYTFIRPIELRRLKVGDVNLEKRKIFISGENSKNKKVEYVLISKQFAEILTEYKFLERPKDSPLFDLNNDIKYSKNWFSTEFRKICNKLGLPKTYELYGWKHTGVSEHYKKSKDIVFIERSVKPTGL